MTTVSAKTGALTSIRRARSGVSCLVCAVLLVSIALTWGCSGIVSGKSAQTTTPPPQTFSISGAISPAVGGSGANVTLSGMASATTTANGSGAYTFTGLANGTYTVTPSLTGYTYTPGSQNVTVNGANATGVNFTATPQVGPKFNISGTISPVAGGSGATVTLSGVASATTATDGAGNYSFRGLANGTYAVTPSNTGYTFTPSSQGATVNGANVTGVNFTASVQSPHSVSLTWGASPTTTVTGYNVYRSAGSGSLFAKVNSAILSGLAYTDSSVQSGTTYYYVATAVDGSGNESVFSNQVSVAIP
jgi:hypothetical protein